MRHHKPLTWALLVVIVATFVVRADASPECRKLRLQPALNWIGSVVEVVNGFAVLDTYHAPRRLLLFDSNARAYKTIETAAALGLGSERFVPLNLAKASKGRLLLQLAQGAIWLDTALDRIDVDPPFPLVANEAQNRPWLGSLYGNFVFLDPNHLLGYGSVRTHTEHTGTGRPFRLGIVMAQLGETGGAPDQVDLLHQVENNSYYLLGYPLVAAVGGNGYALRMDGQPKLLQVYSTKEGVIARELSDGIPESYQHAVGLKTESTGPNDAGPLYAELEEQSIPIGLYGAGDFVYLLTREPSRTSGTRWLLHKIDPASGARVGSVTLPTASAQISVLPSTEGNWLVFERGRVLPSARQDIETVLEIPGDWIREPRRSPLDGTQSTAICN